MELNKERGISANAIISLEQNRDDFDLLMQVYNKALDKTYNTLMQVKESLKHVYNYDIINNISKRIKTQDSITKKLEKKNYKINFRNIIDKINDIAGIRITCPVKSDIYNVIDIIEEIPDFEIIETKDYLSKPKKSGYSGYHLIIETPIEIEGKKVPVKVEIQIRTMAMDFWATNEHKMRYKTNKKLSIIDTKKLTAYAKIINILDDKMTEIYNKQELA